MQLHFCQANGSRCSVPLQNGHRAHVAHISSHQTSAVPTDGCYALARMTKWPKTCLHPCVWLGKVFGLLATRYTCVHYSYRLKSGIPLRFAETQKSLAASGSTPTANWAACNSCRVPQSQSHNNLSLSSLLRRSTIPNQAVPSNAHAFPLYLTARMRPVGPRTTSSPQINYNRCPLTAVSRAAVVP